MDGLYFSAVFVLLQVYAVSSCGFPGVPAHCSASFSEEVHTKGTVVTYACDRGFELLGPSRRICNDHGRWTPEGIPFCVLNVAAGKAPMQVSTEDAGVPQKALDGSTSEAFSADTCTLTKKEIEPWWYVNLLEPYMVQLVRLDFGKPCCGVNKPAVVEVRVGNNRPDLGTNPLCNRYTGFLIEGQPLFLPCNPPMPGAFMSVHLKSTVPSKLSLCEAFVYTDQALPIERCPQFRDQPPGSTATYNGKCYVFYDRQPANFRDALAFCHSRGGTLVDESNPALQGFISWELWRRHRSDSSSQYWLGAVRDPQEPSNWKWVNGKDVTISFWNAPGGTEGCARFDGSKGWLWDDTDCHAKLNYICQHQPKECGKPDQPPNSTMRAENFEVGASVEYACDDGHLLVGPTVRTCLETGFYDEFPPVCKRIDCGYPAEIPHGSYTLLNGSVSYLSHVQYACEAGYEMAGRSRLVCDIDERWNGPPPRCDVIKCDPPPSIAHGRVIIMDGSTYGAVVRYMCARGFELRGAAAITCLASGLWDSPPPHCYLEEISTTTLSTMTSTTTTSTTTTTTTTPAPITTPPAPITTTPAPITTTPAPITTTPRLIVPTRRRKPSTTYSDTVRLKQETTRTFTPNVTKTTTERTTPKKVTDADSDNSSTSHVPHIIVASLPQENQIFGSGDNIRSEQTPRVNAPSPVDGTRGPRLNFAAVVALGTFGALVFLIAIIVTIVMLIKSRRHNEGNKYQHHDSAQDGFVEVSLDTSSSECRDGMSQYYKRAWDRLQELSNGPPEREPPKDGSEIAVIDASLKPRHHHHHHRFGHSSRDPFVY